MWGRGSTFPFADREQLNDTVVGQDTTPPPAVCYAMAGLLVTAGALVAGLAVAQQPAAASRCRDGRRRVGVHAPRSGFAGRTDLVSPGSVSERFRGDRQAILRTTVPRAGSGRGTIAARLTRVHPCCLCAHMIIRAVLDRQLLLERADSTSRRPCSASAVCKRSTRRRVYRAVDSAGRFPNECLDDRPLDDRSVVQATLMR